MVRENSGISSLCIEGAYARKPQALEFIEVWNLRVSQN